MKKIYIKPETELIVDFVTESIMQETSWNIAGHGNGEIHNGDGTDIGAGGADFDSKGSDWNGWDD